MVTLEDYKRSVDNSKPLHYVIKNNPDDYRIYSHSIDCISIQYKDAGWYIVDLPHRDMRQLSFNKVHLTRSEAGKELIEIIKKDTGIVNE
jgi:hypothetical protein